MQILFHAHAIVSDSFLLACTSYLGIRLSDTQCLALTDDDTSSSEEGDETSSSEEEEEETRGD